jgi:hypothetical protein
VRRALGALVLGGACWLISFHRRGEKGDDNLSTLGSAETRGIVLIGILGFVTG